MAQLTDRGLGWLSDRPLERRNVAWVFISDIFRFSGLMLFGGPVFQMFQAKVGLTTKQIGLIGLGAQISEAISMTTLIGVADRVRRRIPAVSTFLLLMAVEPLGFAILGLLPQKTLAAAAFVVMFGLQAVVRFINGLYHMVGYRMMAHVIRNEIRARFTGINGFLHAVTGMLAGLIATAILEWMKFPRGFSICFGLGVVLYVWAAILIRRLKEMPELESTTHARSLSPLLAIRQVWHLRQFRVLLAPFILRGLADLAMVFVMIVAEKRLELPAAYAGRATIATGAGTFLAYATLGLSVDRFGPALVLFGGNVLIALSLMGVVLTKSRRAFLFYYFLGAWGGTVEGAGVPLSCYYIVPRELMGAWSGARLTLLWISSGFGQWLGGHLLGIFNALPIFFIAALIKLAAGILYWYGFGQIYESDAVAEE